MHVKLLRESLPISNEWLQKIQEATKNDHILSIVKSYVLKGWPNKRKDLNESVRQYWTYKDELTILDNIILKSNLVVIPDSLKEYMMQKIHEGHVGLSTCKIRVRSCVFWPEIIKDLENYVNNCKPCAKFMPNNQKEPLLNHIIEPIPWYKVGMDICTYNEKNYLVIIDYFSKFIEVGKLDDLTSECVIIQCKAIFSRHGIPAYVVTDCGSQFTSDKFKQFANVYQFTHIETSPKHSQSNGQSESGVKIFKYILKKCKEDNSDIYLGLLNYRNTPKPYLPSPAQLMYSRNLNSLIPVPKEFLVSKVVKLEVKELHKHYDTVKKHYDKSAKPLPEVELNQKVMFKKNLESTWDAGQIVKSCEQPRSYLVKDENGHIYRRNRKYISVKPSVKLEPTNQDHSVSDCNKSVADADTSDNVETSIDINEENSESSTLNQPVITRSGRTVKIPEKLNL